MLKIISEYERSNKLVDSILEKILAASDKQIFSQEMSTKLELIKSYITSD